MPNPKQNKLIQFLENSGALASGDPERIKAAKLEFRRAYMRDYLRDYRKRRVVIRNTLDREELAELDRAAGTHGKRRADFFKDAAFAHVRTVYLVPNADIVARLEQNLSIIASELREMARNEPTGLLGRQLALRRLTERVERIETIVTKALREPENLTEYIRRRATEEPSLIERLREILQSCSSRSSQGSEPASNN